MTKLWGESKANKKLIKFGGGFYAGELEYTPKDDSKKSGCTFSKCHTILLAASVVAVAAFAYKKWKK